MKLAPLLLALVCVAAQAEENPFYPPSQRLSATSVVGGIPVASNGVPVPVHGVVVPTIDSAAQRKAKDLEGARMVAIISGEEVWYKPEQGVYVRYPVDGSSVATLEAPRPVDAIQEIKQVISPVTSKPQTADRAKGKSW